MQRFHLSALFADSTEEPPWDEQLRVSHSLSVLIPPNMFCKKRRPSEAMQCSIRDNFPPYHHSHNLETGMSSPQTVGCSLGTLPGLITSV